VLADRLATIVLDHEPGWRLPRRSDLARRYRATAAEIDSAISDLACRNILRQLADGRLCRASPAEYRVTLDQLPWLGSSIDPMGASLTCTSRSILRRVMPEGIGHLLHLPPGAQACAVQSTWDMGGATAAVSTTYLPAHLAALLVPSQDSMAGPGAALNPVPSARETGKFAALPGALHLEVQAPPRWVCRLLRLHPAEPAITLTVRLDDPATGTPVALTVAILHAARFRIAVETSPGEMAARLSDRTDITPVETVPRTRSSVLQDPETEGWVTATMDPQQDQGRRPDAIGRPSMVHVNGVTLDLDRYRVFADGTEVSLARKEYDLLRVLLEGAGRVLTRRDLLDTVWCPGYVDAHRTLNVYIGRLRRKIDPGSAEPRIRTVRGIGYVFDPDRHGAARRSQGS